jgi:hypothetical protein
MKEICIVVKLSNLVHNEGLECCYLDSNVNCDSRARKEDDLATAEIDLYFFPAVTVYCTPFLSHWLKVNSPCTGPEVEAPRFQDNRHMMVVRLSAYAPTAFAPQEKFRYSFVLTGDSALGRIMAFRLVAPCLNQMRHRVPPCHHHCQLQTKAAKKLRGGGMGETRSGEWQALGRLLLDRRLGKNLCLFLLQPHLESWHRRFLSQKNPLTQPYIPCPPSTST